MSLRLGPGIYLGETLDRRVVAGLTLTRTVHRLPSRLPLHTHEAPYFCLVIDGAFDEQAPRADVQHQPAMGARLRPQHAHDVEADVEELATRVRANVDARSAGRRANDVEPSSDRGEAPLENPGTHGFPF